MTSAQRRYEKKQAAKHGMTLEEWLAHKNSKSTKKDTNDIPDDVMANLNRFKKKVTELNPMFVSMMTQAGDEGSWMALWNLMKREWNTNFQPMFRTRKTFEEFFDLSS